MAADDLRRARSKDRRQFIGGSDVRRKPIRSVTAPRPAAFYLDKLDAGGRLITATVARRGALLSASSCPTYDTNGERPRTALDCSGVMAQH